MLPDTPRCPAAAPIAGACASQQGVICRVMQFDHEHDAGTGMNAAQSGFIQHEAEGGIYLNVKSDPSTVTAFCHGDGLPVLTDERREGGQAHHSYCPVWQAEKQRITEGRSELLEAPEPEPVAAGVTVAPTDPFAAARELELLAS